MYVSHPEMIPNAPEIIYQLLLIEKDVLTQRQCINMLFSCKSDLVTTFFSGREKEITRFPPSTQLLLVQSIRNRVKDKPDEKGFWLVFVQRLLNSPSNAVKYECARTLLFLSTKPRIIQAVVECYVRLYSTAV